eukprot:m.317932 g.317932  ORF g.317932 m.317932 type:complete len:63 (+) comp53492_c0_seq1:67-255(+)
MSSCQHIASTEIQQIASNWSRIAVQQRRWEDTNAVQGQLGKYAAPAPTPTLASTNRSCCVTD